ncbi:MAG: sigma-70 family RNA polymerase sigma factor [Verrucomicrobia bacterium]|nr:sigma-70 family RNA polymerase sigma factor [Verrucomicrobiota bacterium]
MKKQSATLALLNAERRTLNRHGRLRETASLPAPVATILLQVSMEPDPAKDFEAEIELLRRIGQGDRKSFEEFYDRLSGLLFSTAYRVLNDQAAVEDVLQDVFVQIWDKAPLYNSSLGKPLTWAVTLTRNKAIDRLRSIQRRGRLQEKIQRESEIFEQFDGRSSSDAVASVETNKLVRRAIEKLSSDQRQVIELAFFSSMTQTEIAEHLNKPLGTIKARIRRGMVKLRELIGPEW